jgi:geranylgeranyl diphosphate synthase type II
MNLPPFFEEDRQAVDEQLEKLLPGETVQPPSIHTAMRYSVFAGGKRVPRCALPPLPRAAGKIPRHCRWPARSSAFIPIR